MTHVDLFSGIGGFALAARWAGIKTVQFVEIDPFCHKVLNKNFPGVPIHDDVKTFKYSGASPFILTAGTPCQPASCAGKRRGAEDDRWLWGEVDRVIRHVKSRWIILENVLGLATLAEQYSDIKVENKTVIRLAGSDFYKGIFTRQEILQLGIIIQKVEDAGYQLPELKDGTPIILVVPACAVNAPHERKRIWIVANCPDTRIESLRRERENTVFRVSDAQDSCRCGLNQGSTSMPGQESGSSFSSDADCHAADTTSEQAHTAEPRGLHAESCGKDTDVTDTGNARLQGSKQQGTYGEWQGAYVPITECNHAWNEPWIEAASRLCALDDGVSVGLARPGRNKNRVQKLKAAGNAIVPQVAYQIMKAILEVST